VNRLAEPRQANYLSLWSSPVVNAAAPVIELVAFLSIAKPRKGKLTEMMMSG